MIVYGIHPVEELLRLHPGRIIQLHLTSTRQGPALQAIRARAEEEGVLVDMVDPRQLDQMAQDANHQGVVVECLPFVYAELEEVLGALGDRPRACVLVLEQVQDAGNLGAILRSAAGFGADAVILPKDRAVGVTPAVVRASAGMAFRVPVVRVTNTSRTLEELKRHDFWAVAAAAERGKPIETLDLRMRVALVMGGEHQGIRRLVQEHCDLEAYIPMTPGVESLNVGVATAVMLYEIGRQWRQETPAPPRS